MQWRQPSTRHGVPLGTPVAGGTVGLDANPTPLLTLVGATTSMVAR